MPSFAELVQQGSTHLWLFIPSAILLGALHGLEPGHSKTMMAAFIIAIRGTVRQAVLLGLSATVSHTAVVWAVALTGMHYFGGKWNAETTEPYFQFVSGLLIVGVAVWMFIRTRREQRRDEIESDTHNHDHHGHDHHGHDHHGHDHHGHDHHGHDHHGHDHHGHDHHGHHNDHHHDEIRRIDTGHGVIALSIMEEGMPPHFWISFEHGSDKAPPPRGAVFTVETERPDGSRQLFKFVNKGDYLESTEAIPEPHDFTARVSMAHGDHAHQYDVVFAEHGHDHGGLDLHVTGYQDAHEMAHANDIRRRFANRNVTTGQIVVFGLTGGLIPCPAAITVLLLCLQLKQLPLGVTLVLCFSIGLALTMVATGTLAALSLRHVSKRFSGFGDIARHAPYISSIVIICMGGFIAFQGWHDMPQHDIAAILAAFHPR